jgi:hypothetical protein
MRSLIVLALLVLVLPAHADAQPPPVAPLVLRVPASVRATALGDAWVAGRDQDVIFYNPAQLIGLRQDFSVSLARRGPASTLASMSSVYAAGKLSLTLGWGVKVVSFTTRANEPYPYTLDVLSTRGPADAMSVAATAGGAIAYRGFRIGAAGKYVSDRISGTTSDAGTTNHRALLADLGVAHSLLGGMAGLSVQNLGHRTISDAPGVRLPRQILAGWSTVKQAGPVDLGLFTQVAARRGWVTPGAGLEVLYSWIEGYSVALRAGARRPETSAERPVAIGGAFTADRFTFEYALQFLDDGRHAHGMTVRWR